MSDVITRGGSDRGGKVCLCAACGRQTECSMFDDYYTLAGDDNGPLYCEACVMRQSPVDGVAA